MSKLTPLIPTDLDDFDILLFKGSDYWFSYIVEYFTWSNFSHVGLFLNGAVEISPDLTQILFFESGSETWPDEVDHKIKWGVQITDFKKVIENYDGKIYCRKLHIPLEKRKELKSLLADIYSKISDLPYDCSICDLLRVEFDADVGDVQRTNSFFCSALVCYVYIKLGLLSSDLSWDLISPKDFGTNYMDSKLLDGIKLDPLTRIK